MLLTELADKLRVDYPAMRTNIAIDEEISKAKLLPYQHGELEPNTLFVGDQNAAELLKDGQIKSGNVLLTQQTDCVFPDACNWICLSTKDLLPSVFNRLQDLIAESNRYIKSSTSLLDCIIKGKELRDVIETGFDILDNPIMLMDTSYKVLAYKTNETIDDPVWADLVENGYSSHKYVSLFKHERIIEKILLNDMPIVLDTGVAESLRRILGKIMLNGSCKGYVAVLEYNHKLVEQDVQITKLICEVISSLMMSGHDRLKNNAGAMHEMIIHDLLENKNADAKSLAGRLHACQWQIGKCLVSMIVDMDKYNDVSFIDFFRNKLNDLLPGSKSVYYEDALVFIFDVGETKTFIGGEWYSRIHQFFVQNDLIAGISRPFCDLLQLPKYHRQSQRALAIGKILLIEQRIFNYSDVEIEDFIAESSSHVDVMNYCHEGILRLRDFDAEKNTSYFDTLYTYLMHDKNVNATAENLFLHRNTVNYRIEKIEDILGVSLRSCVETFHMLLTYRLLNAVKYMHHQESHT